MKWADIEMQGNPRWYESSPGKARRGFCGTCSSHLLWEEFDSIAYLMVGAFDQPSGPHSDSEGR